MASPAKIIAAFFVLLVVVGGCSAGPEVVATERVRPLNDGSLLVLPPLHQGCRVGIYIGSFVTAPLGDAAAVFPLDGQFTFELVEGRSGGGGEFPTLKDDVPLSGKSLDSTISFTGTVKSGSDCHDGHFQSQVVDGQFWAVAGAPVAFDGTVDGFYDAKADEFSGTWAIEPLILGGRWTAIRAAKQK